MNTKNTASVRIRPIGLAAALAGTVGLLAPDANAQVTVVGGTLTIVASAGGLNSKIVAGPAPGVVRLHQVPGAVDGQRFNGIRAVRVLSGPAADQLEFEVSQTTPFEVFADTGLGDSEVKVKWVVPAIPVPTATAVNPKLTVRQGAGSKKTWLDFESSAANVDLDWTVNASGAGSGEMTGIVLFREGSLRTTSDIVLNGGTGGDKIDLVVDSMSDQLRVDVLSRGVEIVGAQVLADDPGTSLDVLFDVVGAATSNLVELGVISAIENVRLDVAVDGGSRADDLKIAMTQVAPGNIESTLDLDLGLGDDKIDIKYDGQVSLLDLGGLVNAGGGRDEIKLYSEFDTTSGAVLSGGEGNDHLLAEVKGLLSGDGAASLRLLGGGGNDQLLLKADGGVAGTPPVIDGGAGFDTGAGPGTIINVEAGL